MSTIQDNDQFLVQRGATTYKQSAVNLMSTIQDTDLMLVQRGTESFRVTCEDVKDQLGGGGGGSTAPLLYDVILAQNAPIDANRYTGKSFTTTVVNAGGAATTLEMTGTVTGALGIKAGSDPIAVNAYPGTSSTDVVLTLEGEANLGDVIEVGNTVTASASYTPETSEIASVSSGYSAPDFPNIGSSGGWDSSAANLIDGNSSTFAQSKGGTGSNPVVLTGTFNVGDELTFDIQNGTGNTRIYDEPNNKYYFATDGVPIVLTSATNLFKLHDYTSNDTIVKWNLRGKSTTVITLPTNKDINLFQVGDVVQGGVYDVSTLAPSGWKDGDSDASKVFDGDSATLIARYNGGSRTYELKTPIDLDVRGQTVELLAHQYNKDDDFECQIKFDGNSAYITRADGVPVGGDPPAWVTATVPENIGTKLTGVFLYSYAGTTHAIELYGVRVNGQVINFNDGTFNTGAGTKVISTDVAAKTISVDGGNWEGSDGSGVSPIDDSLYDQNEDWPTIINILNLGSGASREDAFDYDLTTSAYGNARGEMNVRCDQAPPETITSFEVYTLSDSGSFSVTGNYTPQINKGPGWYSLDPTQFNNGGWTVGTSFSVDCRSTSATVPSIAALRINGKVVVTSAFVNPSGDTKVSTSSPKQGSGTVSNITGAQVTVSPFTDNCFKEGQWLTVNKTIDVDPKTDKITSYDDSTKVITVDGDTDLMQFAAGDSVFMTDNSTDSASTKTGYKLTTTDIESAEAAGISDFVQYCSGSAQGSFPFTHLFDGDTSTRTTPATGASAKWDISSTGGITVRTSLRVYQGISGDGGSRYKVNGATHPDGFQSNRWINLTPTLGDLPATLEDIEWNRVSGAGACDPSAIEIDGVVLIQGTVYPPDIALTFSGDVSTNPDLQYFRAGDVVDSQINSDSVNTSQNFSAQVTGTSGENACFKFGKTVGTADTPLVLKFSPAIPSGGQVSLYGNKGMNGSGVYFNVSINGEAATQVGGNGFQPWSSTFYGNISSLTITTGGPNSPGGLIPQVRDVVINNQRMVDNNVPADQYPAEYTNDISVISTDLVNNTMVVDGGTWAQGDRVEYQTTGGTGTIADGGIDIASKTITLTASEVGDARWIVENKAGTEFRVATATKPAVATTAYLKFNAAGAVTGYQATPVEPRAMSNLSNPKLTFPATFSDTGTAPDTEFPDASAYIQTSVQLKNSEGDSAIKASNEVVPQTNQRLVGPGEVGNNADELKAMGMQMATHDQRVADHTAAQRQQRIDDFEANLRRYSSFWTIAFPNINEAWEDGET